MFAFDVFSWQLLCNYDQYRCFEPQIIQQSIVDTNVENFNFVFCFFLSIITFLTRDGQDLLRPYIRLDTCAKKAMGVNLCAGCWHPWYSSIPTPTYIVTDTWSTIVYYLLLLLIIIISSLICLHSMFFLKNFL